MAAEVFIYSTRNCPYCVTAKQILNRKQIEFTDIALDGNQALQLEMQQKSGRRTVPQIWINNVHIGGCSELMKLEASGELDAMLTEVV